MRLSMFAAAALLVAPFQNSCDLGDLAGASDAYREDFRYSYDLKPGGTLSVENFNGPVEILSWEKNTVQITGAKYASREENMRAIRIDIKAAPDSIVIRTVRPAEVRSGNMGARYFIRVPREVELALVHSSNGQLRVEDTQGGARLETSNAPVRLRALNGRLDVRTSNGSIECDDIAGDAVLHTSNASVRGDRFRGAVEAVTSNGSIHMAGFAPPAGRPLRFQTSNASIDLTFDEWQGNPVQASSSNGSITLRLPANARAEIKATTTNSSITSDLDISMRGPISKTRIDGTLNGGGPLIDLSTSNAPIRLTKML
jgi:DUF4097 and DUF4098 domain-containing protein YvlB